MASRIPEFQGLVRITIPTCKLYLNISSRESFFSPFLTVSYPLCYSLIRSKFDLPPLFLFHPPIPFRVVSYPAPLVFTRPLTRIHHTDSHLMAVSIHNARRTCDWRFPSTPQEVPAAILFAPSPVPLSRFLTKLASIHPICPVSCSPPYFPFRLSSGNSHKAHPLADLRSIVGAGLLSFSSN